jgi:competence protein ComFC
MLSWAPVAQQDSASPTSIPPAQRLRRWLADACDSVTSVFFPAPCRLCDLLLTGSSRIPICGECLNSFARVPEPICEVCGVPLPAFGVKEVKSLFCSSCQQKQFTFDRVRSLGVYEGSLGKAVLLLKYEKMEPLGVWFAEKLARVAQVEHEAFQADVVAPVPLHPVREKERGYNQATLISKPLAKRLRLPHQSILLTRTRARPEKRLLSLDERWESVRGAFATRPSSQVDNRRVLLVDDVLTTGATLDACARALREAGAKSVLGLTVARAVRGHQAGSKP